MNSLNISRINKVKDTIETIFSQDTLDSYFNYLIADSENRIKQGKKGGSAGNINDKCELVKRLINYANKNIKFRKYRDIIKNVTYQKLDIPKQDDSKKCEILEEEIKLLESVSLNERLSEYRDLFMVEIACGQRISDIQKLFGGEVLNKDNDFITIKTKKEKIEAIVIKTEKVTELLEKYKYGFNHVNIESKNLSTILDKEIKIISKKANLNRIIKYQIKKGYKEIEKEEPLYNLISSHYARHTYITRMIRAGWDKERLCYVTGHANKKMIEEVYSHLTNEDKKNIVKEEYLRVERIKNSQPNFIESKEDMIKEMKNVLMFLNVPEKQYKDITDIDELNCMIYVDYSAKFQYEYGIDTREIKQLYNNENIGMADKIITLNKWIEEAKQKIAEKK